MRRPHTPTYQSHLADCIAGTPGNYFVGPIGAA
jgi:hypothetical protein